MNILLSLAAGVLSMLAFAVSADGYVGVSDPPLAAFSPVWLLYALVLGGLWFLFFSLTIKPRLPGRPRGGAGAACKQANATLAASCVTKPELSKQAGSIKTQPKGSRFGVSKGQIALGLCLGAVNYFASSLFAYDTWGYLNTVWQWGKAVLQILGQAAVMAMAAALVCRWLEGGNRAEGKRMAAFFTRVSSGRLGRAYRGRPLLFVTGALLLCWSPYLLIFFPGTVVWDMAEMLAMQEGLRAMTNWHPVLLTWAFSGLVRLGRLFSGDNLGVFCYTLIQSALLAYALARALELARRLGASRLFRLCALLFFAASPVFASFAQAVGKDTLYAALVLLFTVQTVEWLKFGGQKARAAIALGVTALCLCLVRNNGLYVLLPTAVMLAIALRGKLRWLAAGALGAALALVFAFNGVLVPALGITDATASGIYSVAFQQSARALRDTAVTAEEYAAIDQVLDAEHLAALYEPNISDPVKYTFRQYGLGREAEKAALSQYRKAWLSMLKKYPLTYLEAFVAGSTGYYAFTPKIDAARTYHYQGGTRFLFETVAAGDDPLDLHTVQPPAFAGARALLAMYARGWRRVPILELFLFCASYTWLLLIAALSLLRQRRARDLIAFLPAFFTLLACTISPVNDYFRYFLPAVATFVPLLALAKRRENGEENKE